MARLGGVCVCVPQRLLWENLPPSLLLRVRSELTMCIDWLVSEEVDELGGMLCEINSSTRGYPLHEGLLWGPQVFARCFGGGC